MISRRFFSALGVCLIVAQAHSQSLPPAEYGIKQDQPAIGSNILRYAVKPGNIPINRRYAELTAEEKAIVHAPYEAIAPGDEPPFPADGLKPLFNAIRNGQRYLLVKGSLRLIATVDATGDVQSVEVLASPDAEVTTFVAKLLMATKFKPALCHGLPCRMEYPLNLQFNVE
jgi:hypothetical protein